MLHRATSPVIMNELLPRPLDAIAYGFTLVLSLGMIAAIIFFIATRCERILEQTGTGGACGIGIGWILFCIAFLAIAIYSAAQLCGLWKERT
ncbi:hypothetical protein [uncultured Methanoregula sp.]|uniref:hypothetical protein n=1 Tax=uncultured Methanoregula sp. TaxID=1005933 RepID=UPI002AAB579F|nr:hypothetical protein [uncultured Methanoregula sp.]